MPVESVGNVMLSTAPAVRPFRWGFFLADVQQQNQPGFDQLGRTFVSGRDRFEPERLFGHCLISSCRAVL